MRKMPVAFTSLLLGALVAAMLVPVWVGASSHREAPLMSMDPNADLTDLYAFASPDKPDTVTIIANVIPFEAAYGGPNYFRFADDVLYQIHVDNNGDAMHDIEYQLRFKTITRNPATFLYNVGPINAINDADWNVYQVYDVARLEYDRNGNKTSSQVVGGFLRTPPANIGPKSSPDYDAVATAAVHSLTDGSKVFAGQRDDPFFADLSAIFDLLTIRKLPGNQGGGSDGLARYNVHSIALQVPINRVTANGAMPSSEKDPNAVIGVWATTSRQAMRVLPDMNPAGSGNFVQVSRLGQPLVNEVVVPVGFKDHFNGSQPKDDVQFLGGVTDPEVPKLLNLLYGIKVPPTPRNDLVQVFLTGVPGLNQPANVKPSEQLRLNTMIKPTASPNRLGVVGGDLQGFPNGRRLGDDVIDIAFRAMAGVLVDGFGIEPNNQLGDGVDANDKEFMSTFPYVASPWQGFEVGTQYMSLPK